MQQKRQDYLNELYNQIADELSISDTMTTKAISSYEAVGKWLGDCEPGLDVKIMPQGSFNLGTVIKPLSDKDDYDIDLVCLLKNGGELEAKKIKNVVGDRLKEHKMYYSMLEKEGKRCWTLQYDEFHMDILPSVPNNIIFDEQKDTEIRLTHKNSQNQYEDRYSNPYQYRIWFENCMQTILQNVKKEFAYRNKVEISQVATYRVKTPLQKAVQLLKRHRDIMFEKVDCDDAPISIIITTLAGKAYNNETNLYDALKNIVEFMPNYIEIDNEGKQHLKDMQEDTVLNNLKVQAQAASERLQERCNIMKEQLFVVKDNIKSKATDIVVEAKKKGKAALNKISELFDVKDKLMGIRAHVKESQKEVSATIAKIDAFGSGMREANQKIANTFRTFADKETVDYSHSEKQWSKTEMVKKPWIAKQKMLEEMELRLDAAIDKTENLARDVEINHMMMTFDSLMVKAQDEKVSAMIAEPNSQYGADAF